MPAFVMLLRYFAALLVLGLLHARAIPLQRTSSDRLTARIVVGGKTADLQLDTGAAISVLDAEFANAARLKRSGTGKIYAPHSVVESSLAKATVVIPGSKMKAARFHIADLRRIDPGLIGEGDVVHGILGSDILHRISGTLRIKRRELAIDDLAPDTPDGTDMIRLKYQHGLGYVGTVRFGGIDARALIDTGAVTTRITTPLARQLAAELKIDEAGNTYAVLESVSVGRLKIYNVPVLVIGPSPGSDEYPRMKSVTAYVGMDLLMAIDAEIDLREPRLRFRL